MSPRSPYQVHIRGLEIYAYHGVPDHEQATGHRYRLDLDLSVFGRADISDDVADTVDYGAVSQTALRVINGPKRRTLERLARLVAEAVLAEYREVVSVSVKIEKPFPPAPVIAESMGVTFCLERENPPQDHSLS